MREALEYSNPLPELFGPELPPRILLETETTKECARCWKELEKREFYRFLDGQLYNTCKDCHKSLASCHRWVRISPSLDTLWLNSGSRISKFRKITDARNEYGWELGNDSEFTHVDGEANSRTGGRSYQDRADEDRLLAALAVLEELTE